ncbi:hypothetical protein A3J89_01940 [Candidatus Curtissbacteria bacterium RIFOXYB12_FULL_40_6]|nr:MAG: hypothetical protein A3J89_01940 [Candidatus Curtissbacteria bacterium RIFOXYB12_FULL_40_6]
MKDSSQNKKYSLSFFMGELHHLFDKSMIMRKPESKKESEQEREKKKETIKLLSEYSLNMGYMIEQLDTWARAYNQDDEYYGSPDDDEDPFDESPVGIINQQYNDAQTNRLQEDLANYRAEGFTPEIDRKEMEFQITELASLIKKVAEISDKDWQTFLEAKPESLPVAIDINEDLAHIPPSKNVTPRERTNILKQLSEGWARFQPLLADIAGLGSAYEQLEQTDLDELSIRRSQEQIKKISSRYTDERKTMAIGDELRDIKNAWTDLLFQLCRISPDERAEIEDELYSEANGKGDFFGEEES